MANKELMIRIAADSREAVAAMKKIDQASQQTAGVMGKLDGAMKGALAAFSAGAVLDFAGDTLRAASDLQESTNAIRVTFGEAADSVLEFGATAAESAGLAASEFNNLVVPIGAMLQNFGLSADEAAAKSIELAQRAADMASVFNVDVSEALGAVQAGLRGEADPLERFGVGLNAAAVEAYALENGLAATKAEIDDNIKVQARLGLLMEQTNRVAGDFANTSDGLANQQRIAAAEAENLKAEIGEELQPAALALLQTFRELAPTVASTAGEIAAMVSELAPLVDLFGNTIGRVLESKKAWDDASESLNYFEQLLGVAHDSMATMLSPVEKLIEVFGDLVPEQEEAAETVEDLGEKQRGTKRTTEDLSDVTEEAATKFEAASLRTGDFRRAIEDLSRTQAEAADPALALINASLRLEDAQEKVNDAIKEHGRNSDEARDASLDLVSAQGDLEAASARFGREGGAESVEALRQMAERAGVSEDYINDVIEAIERLNSTSIKLPGLRDDGTFNPGGGGGGSIAQFVPVASKTLSAPGPAPSAAPPMPPIVVQFVVDGRKFFEEVIVPQAERYAKRTGRSVFP